MFLFPIIYVLAFAVAIYHLLQSKVSGALIFIIFGLPIYITSLSVTFLYGLPLLVPVMQAFKEVIILLAFLVAVASLKRRPRLYLADKLVLVYFGWVLVYALLPLGDFSLKERLIALKSISFFPFIYFTGRLMDPRQVNLNRYFQYICLIAIPAAVVVLWEAVNYTHFQTFTGYAEYMRYFFQLEPSGHHGLNWTFEAENDGPKRFASIFANPLDHAAGTLTVVAAILALITTRTKKIQGNSFLILAFFCTLASIIFALSRASFVSYFIMIYAYALVTGRREWLRYFHYGAGAVALLFFLFMSGEIYDFIIATLNFTNSSSIYHILQWVEGIEAIVTHPFGLGMGAAGRIGAMQGVNVGGENQLLIIGVQAGIVALGLFTFIYIYLIRAAIKTIAERKEKARKVAIFVLLLKLGMIIPFLTAEAESYVYVSYITWFFSGLMINIKYSTNDSRSGYMGPSGS